MARYHVPLAFVCDLKTREVAIRGLDGYAHRYDDLVDADLEERAEPEAPQVSPSVKRLFERQRRSKAAVYKTKAWFDQRATRVNGSEAACVLGKNKYEKVRRFWQKKTGQIPRDHGVSQYMVQWGNRHEAEAMQVYAVLTRTRYLLDNTGSVVHPEHDFIAATPDFVTLDGVLVEIKCPRTRKIEHTAPELYYPQLQVQLAVCGLTTCHFVQYKPPTLEAAGELDVLVIKFDPLWFAQIVEPCRDFSNAIKAFYAALGLEPGADTRGCKPIDVLRAEAPLLPKLLRNAEWCEQFLSGYEEVRPTDALAGPDAEAAEELESPDKDDGAVCFRVCVQSDVSVYAN
jgi:putative phage-type endonuclease